MSIDNIESKLESLSAEAKKLEPNAFERHSLVVAVDTYAQDFLEKLDDAPAFIKDHDGENPFLGDQISEDGEEIHSLLQKIDDRIDKPGIAAAGGGHLGYIPGGGVFPGALGDYLAAVGNKYAGVFFGGPGAVRLENSLIRWMADLIGFPKEAAGNLTSGGSMANLIGLVTARDAMGLKARDYEKACFYLTKQIHHSVTKAITISGLGEANIRYVGMDDKYRMDPEQLKSQIQIDVRQGLKPFMVIASAGTTDVGAVDPLEEITKICKDSGAWCHVDAAYGGFFILAPETKALFKGIENADSISIDPHKGLFLPYGIGTVLVRDVKLLNGPHTYQASYMQDSISESYDWSPADLSPELTKHFRGLRMWLPLKLFGIKPFRSALSEKLWLTRYFLEKIKDIKGAHILLEPQLSVGVYRFFPQVSKLDANAFNLLLTQKIQEDGTVFISSTMIDEKVFLRLAVLSFRTHKHTIDRYLTVLNRILSEIDC